MTGITRAHGTAETGVSGNLTGVKSTFFGGYQPLFVTVKTVSAQDDFTTGLGTVDSKFEKCIRAAQTVGSVVGYGIPSNAASSSTFVIMFDNASLNQGDGVAGSGVTTGLGILAANLNAICTGDVTLATYNGFTGAALSLSA